MNQILTLILVTMLPFFELRASIPLGILKGTVELPLGLSLSGFGMHWFNVFLICVISNMILGPIVYLALDLFGDLLVMIPVLNKFYHRKIERTRDKAQGYIDKYGPIGLALFIAVPLPGSGSYTGALAAQILGIGWRRFVIVNCIGVTIAGMIVTMLSLGVLHI